MRKKLTTTQERNILVKNRHCCCICQRDSIGQDVLIHHIDGNPANNTAPNLAVLCLQHASMADAALFKGKLGSGKKLKASEVREYKKIWETKIDLENKYRRHAIPVARRKQLETLFHFEIRKTINEIVSLKDTDPDLKERFEYLDQLYFEEAVSNLNLRKLLLQAYSDISFQTIERAELPKRL
jgi:hypothetical protein